MLYILEIVLQLIFLAVMLQNDDAFPFRNLFQFYESLMAGSILITRHHVCPPLQRPSTPSGRAAPPDAPSRPALYLYSFFLSPLAGRAPHSVPRPAANAATLSQRLPNESRQPVSATEPQAITANVKWLRTKGGDGGCICLNQWHRCEIMQR